MTMKRMMRCCDDGEYDDDDGDGVDDDYDVYDDDDDDEGDRWNDNDDIITIKNFVYMMLTIYLQMSHPSLLYCNLELVDKANRYIYSSTISYKIYIKCILNKCAQSN